MIKSLRNLMKKKSVDACIIPTADPHLGEYIPEHYKLRQYLSGFTGSAGTLVITENKAGLWTDGRYYIQAEKELSGKDIELYKASEKDCIKTYEFLKKELKEGAVVGVDGCLFSKKQLDKIITELENSNIDVITDFDGAVIWENRPQLPKEKIFLLPKEFCGERLCEKVKKVRSLMKKEGFTHYLVTMPECIMWLLNIRGCDVLHTPVALSYMLLSKDEARLYVDSGKAADIKEYLNENKIEICSYNEIYTDLKKLDDASYVAVDFETANYNLVKSISCMYKNRKDYITDLKCIRTKKEIDNIKKAYIKENTALVKSFFEIYLKDDLTEYDVVNIIEKNRKNIKGYFSPSFDTIAAFGKNAAMVHYTPKEKKSAKIEKDGLLLIDTGGQYFEGTTDTTRTLVLGNISDEEKKSLTLVLKANISLINTVFPKGKKGRDLDSIARNHLWKNGLDYKHGTGHGIGYFLSVHECPQRISPFCEEEIKENMTLSDEPGVYIENKYGIRIENHLCVKEYNEEFLCFDILNYCPIATKEIMCELLAPDEIMWINSYNENCRKLLLPYITEEENEWLKNYTAKI